MPSKCWIFPGHVSLQECINQSFDIYILNSVKAMPDFIDLQHSLEQIESIQHVESLWRLKRFLSIKPPKIVFVYGT